MPLGLFSAIVPASVTGKGEMVLVPPPRFRAAEGVRSAWLSGEGPFGRTPERSGTAAQKAGRRYERKALNFLSDWFGSGFRKSQWFQFRDASGLRWCQVDGLHQDDKGVIIFEVKAHFTPDAWWQLRKLYEPVVETALRPKRVWLVLVCGSFDPAVRFPEPFRKVEFVSDWRDDLKCIGVFHWST